MKVEVKEMDKFCKDCKHSFLENQKVTGWIQTKPIPTPIYAKILKCRKEVKTMKDNVRGEYKVYEGVESGNLNNFFDCERFELAETKGSWISRLFEGG